MGKDYLGADQRKAKTGKEGEEKEIKVTQRIQSAKEKKQRCK